MKTRVMVLYPKKQLHPANPNIQLTSTQVKTSQAETHLVIVRNSSGINAETISIRVKAARQNGYSLMGAGVDTKVGRHRSIFIMPRMS